MRLETHRNGTVAELEAQQKFVGMGFPVSVPITEERYDMIVDLGDELLRVKVKSGYYKDGNDERLTCDFRAGVNNAPYEGEEIDGFAVYDHENARIYWLPVEDAPRTTTTKRVDKWDELRSGLIV